MPGDNVYVFQVKEASSAELTGIIEKLRDYALIRVSPFGVLPATYMVQKQKFVKKAGNRIIQKKVESGFVRVVSNQVWTEKFPDIVGKVLSDNDLSFAATSVAMVRYNYLGMSAHPVYLEERVLAYSVKSSAKVV